MQPPSTAKTGVGAAGLGGEVGLWLVGWGWGCGVKKGGLRGMGGCPTAEAVLLQY